MMKKCLGILVAAFLFSTVGYFVMPTQEVEAAPLRITTITTHWRELANDGSICDSGSSVRVHRHEPWLHRINIFAHPHNTIRVLRTINDDIWLGVPTCW